MASYTGTQQEAGQRAMVLEGVFSRAMEGVTGGVILAGFALALGATDLEIGLIAAIPFLAQLAHIPALFVLARFPDRRLLTVGAATASRLTFLAMAALPFLDVPSGRRVPLLVLLLLAYAVLATLAGAAWQVWVRELVPRERLGRYFGRRMAILSFVGLVTILAAGQLVTRLGSSPASFSLLFALGTILGLASCALLLRAPSNPSPAMMEGGFGARLKAPLRDANHRRLLLFLGAWGSAANVSLPFVSVVLLRDVGYSVGTVIGLAAISQVANIAGLRLWSPLTDRFANKPVLGLSAGVFLVAMLTWTLIPKVAGTPLLVAAAFVHILLGFALAGLDVASNGIVMKLAPEAEAPSYLASASVVKALAAGIAPLLAGLAATALHGRELRVLLAWGAPEDAGVLTALRFGPYDVLFFSSVLFGIYALHRLLALHEEGEAPPEAVMRAMRREVGQVSSVAGMRTFAHVASYVVEVGYRFERVIGAAQHPRRPPRDSPDERDAR